MASVHIEIDHTTGRTEVSIDRPELADALIAAANYLIAPHQSLVMGRLRAGLDSVRQAMTALRSGDRVLDEPPEGTIVKIEHTAGNFVVAVRHDTLVREGSEVAELRWWLAGNIEPHTWAELLDHGGRAFVMKPTGGTHG